MIKYSKIIFSLVVCVISTSISVFAQRDIKTLNKKTSAEVISIIGEPASKELGEEIENEDKLFYEDTYLRVDNINKALLYFQTASSSYCILSDVIAGGIKVGDSVTKIQSFDFVHSRYGRNKSGNSLRVCKDYRICGRVSDYIAYQEEYERLCFVVKDGIIIAWAYITAPDIPYPEYDLNNSLL